MIVCLTWLRTCGPSWRLQGLQSTTNKNNKILIDADVFLEHYQKAVGSHRDKITVDIADNNYKDNTDNKYNNDNNGNDDDILIVI